MHLTLDRRHKTHAFCGLTSIGGTAVKSDLSSVLKGDFDCVSELSESGDADAASCLALGGMSLS